jgi:pimeloyl-ACP methyl ester carboxylesterase
VVVFRFDSGIIHIVTANHLQRNKMSQQVTNRKGPKQTDIGTKGTIVFIHGFHDGSDIWADAIREMKTPNLQTISFDLPGMGTKTNDAGPFTLERYANDVRLLINHIDGPVVVVAHSMGAQIVELAIADRSKRVDGLVLIAPIGLAGAGMSREAADQFKFLASTPEGERQLRKTLMASSTGPSFEHMVDVGSRVRPDVTSQLVDTWNNGSEDGLNPSRYMGPVLVARGAEDPFVTHESLGEAVLPRFKNLTSTTIANAGHWPQSEQPAVVAKLVDQFLSEMKWSAFGIATIHSPQGNASSNTSGGTLSQGWASAFADKSESSFADSLASNVSFEASVFTRPIEGRDDVKITLATASKIYESLAFTKQTEAGDRTYLEWEATAFGGQRVVGVTVLTKDEHGKIIRIAIHHRALGMLLRFSAELGKRLHGVIASDFFYQGT